MFWYFNIFIGFLFVVSGLILGYSYYKQKINGLSLAMVLILVEAGLLHIASSLLFFNFHLMSLAIGLQVVLILTMVYLVRKLYDSTEETEQKTKRRGTKRKADKQPRYDKLRD